VAKTTEKLVLSLDLQSQSYKPAGHNLLPGQALEQAEKLSSENFTALIVDQQSHHRQLNLSRCKLCKKASEEETNKRNSTSGQQPPEAAGADEESEGE
jgi:hypothetical protein